MDQKINKILKDIYLIAPELSEKENELKEKIKMLIQTKPESEGDPGFKKDLLEKILNKYGKSEVKKQTNRAFYLKPAFISLIAASIFIIMIGINKYLPQINNNETDHYEMPPLISRKNTSKVNKVKVQDTMEVSKKKDQPKNKKQKPKLIAPIAIPGEIIDEDELSFEDKNSSVVNKSDIEENDGGIEVIVNVTMELKKLKETIIVEGQAPQIDVKSSSQGMTPNKTTFNTLPKGRDFSGIITTKPGVQSNRKSINNESYGKIKNNDFINPLTTPLSTFSIDVDTASYSNMRRFLMNRTFPPSNAIRVEELINYFPYNYPKPDNNNPFSINTEVSTCPWNKDHALVLIGLKGREIKDNKLPPSNLVFLIDVSGSMGDHQKLPLLIKSFKLLTSELKENDKISIVVYAGSAGLLLPTVNGNQKDLIFKALNRLNAGGSTAGGQGIKLAYQIAENNFIKNGNNRIVLATDGDFNVGASSDREMEKLIESKRDKGVFLTVLGFGMGNYKDSKMEILADKGNGNYFYIDSLMEANKVLVNDLRKTMFTIAKDVKIQVEFNPAKIKSYKLIGYENRMLKKEDFANDKKDAGEIGAGHTVTVLYEVALRKKGEELKDENGLKYQKKQIKSEALNSFEMMTVKLRHKKPDENKSTLISRVITQNITTMSETSNNFRFASSVAEFGLILRNSKNKEDASFSAVLKRARNAMGNDKFGYRKEFLKLVKIAADISKNK